MATIVGGLRQRLITESVFIHLKDSLDMVDETWLTTSAYRTDITFSINEPNIKEEIAPNTLYLFPEDKRVDGVEMGSNLSEFSRTYYLDFFAENMTIGEHLIGDAADILEGRFPLIASSTIDVYNWPMATPDLIFSVLVEDVQTDRAKDWPSPWLKYWYSCMFTIVDCYGSLE